MRPALLISSYLSICLLPLLLAWLGARPARSFPDELATGAGMLAFSIILIEFIISGRFKSIADQFGLDVVMRFHQLAARTALGLALVHPFLYSAPFMAQYPSDPTRQLSLTMNFQALGTGLIAWVLLPAFIVLAIYHDKLAYKYEYWRFLHGIGAVVIALFVLHHALYSGRYSEDPVLVYYWLGMFAVAISSLVYVYLFRPLFQMKSRWEVVSVKPLAKRTWELAIEPVGHKGLHYLAGQFAWLKIGEHSFSFKENPFSISSCPSSGHKIRFVIKELGDFTRTVGSIKTGSRAFIDGPYGNMVAPVSPEGGLALIAGGVGVAPLIGILRDLRATKDKRPVTLIYGNRTEDQIIYRDELDEFSKDPDTRIELVLSEPGEGWQGHNGLLDEALIKRCVSADMLSWHFLLCGPVKMMENAEETLIKMGVPSQNIMSERFRYD